MSGRLGSGTIVDGRYSVKERVGAGGMAEVYKAEDLQLGRKVALKVLYSRFAEDEEFLERFRREASSAAGLQHQNVVSVYDRGEFEDTAYIAMEYVDGKTLKAIVTEEGPLPPERAIELTVQILRAARFAHKRGVIHRDFKPHNVIVDAEDRAKVTDFGIARAGASDMTQTGSIMGTAQYLSPEQAQGLPVSAQSDLYSIGILLFELLTGRVPFESDSAVAIALKQVSETPPRPSALNPAITPELERVVLRALEKEPARRFADADEFAAALLAAERSLGLTTATAPVAAAGGPPPPIIPLSQPTTGWGSAVPVGAGGITSESYAYPQQPLPPEPPRERRRWWIPLVAGLLVAAALVGGLLLLSGKQVTVPNVTGAPRAEAEVTLRNRGFDTDTVDKRAMEEAGTVIGQNPAGSTQVDEGSLITLTVSSGPGEETVPDTLVGMGRRAARKALTDLGFRVDEVERQSSDVGENRVISVSPDGGQRLERGQTVTLTISSGPESAAVPDVLRQSREDATDALRNAGFEVEVREQERGDVDVGTVVAQDPAGKQVRGQGSTVTITVATAPTTIDVPDTTGDTEAVATGKLAGAGFEVSSRSRETENPDEDGIVLAQTPGNGKAKKGSTVTITTGRFDDSQVLPGGDGTDPGTGATGATTP